MARFWGERESQKHHQPVGVRLQGCALPWHLPRASPGELLNETAPDQSNQFWWEGRGRRLSFLFQAPRA